MPQTDARVVSTHHPGELGEALPALDHYLAHRRQRLEQVEAAVADLRGVTAEELPRRVVAHEPEFVDGGLHAGDLIQQIDDRTVTVETAGPRWADIDLVAALGLVAD